MAKRTYSEAGVDVAKADSFVERLKRTSLRQGHQKLWPGAGGYASVVPVSEDQAVALTTDGVGTKLLLALEQNNLSTIGIDLVAMCANDLLCVGAIPHSFLDYYATGKLNDSDANALISGIIEGCDQAAMMLIGGETAEMPDLYRDRHFDIAGFALGMVAKDQLLTGSEIAVGDTVIGVASNGIHSNGLSLARKVITEGNPLRKELLTPTVIYVKPVVELLKLRKSNPQLVKGIAHITGGGWRNVLRLNKKVGFSFEKLLPVPQIFNAIGEQVELDEMYRTFNMGMGLVIISGEKPELIIETLKEHGLDSQVVGRVSDQSNTLSIATGESGRFETITLTDKTGNIKR
jgi:phosphoribosylformylglycinamidine cyclo-ligase